MNNKRDKGFTLIELLITVTIVVILATIAVPNYRKHVLRSNRSDGMAALTRVAAAQEKFYLQNNTYTTSFGPDGLDLNVNSKYYDIEIESADNAAFLVKAKPRDGQKQDKCDLLSLNHLGERKATSDGKDATAICWR